jgi:hypothetical protein
VGILEYGAETSVERADATDLRERPSVLLEGFGLGLAARQDRADRIEQSLPSPNLGSVLGVVSLLFGASWWYFCFLF